MRTKLLCLLAGLLMASANAVAEPFDRFIGFGDSTIDSGWFIYQPPPAGVNGPLWLTAIANGGGKPTTPYGRMVSELLAARYGLTAFPADRPGGGTNYAAHGAQNDAALLNPRAPSTVSQINTYLASVQGVADAKALYLISSGGNDRTYANNQFVAGVFTQAQAQNYVIAAARSLVSAIKQLQDAGARYLLVPDGQQIVPEDPAYNANPTSLLAIYHTTLYAGLSAQGVHFIPADRAVLSAAIGANPAAFGLQFILNSQQACINPSSATIPRGWALYCTPQLLVTPNAPQTYLWADAEHYTAAGQKVLADYYVNLVNAALESCESAGDDDHHDDRRFDEQHRRLAPVTLCDLWTTAVPSRNGDRR